MHHPFTVLSKDSGPNVDRIENTNWWIASLPLTSRVPLELLLKFIQYLLDMRLSQNFLLLYQMGQDSLKVRGEKILTLDLIGNVPMLLVNHSKIVSNRATKF